MALTPYLTLFLLLACTSADQQFQESNLKAKTDLINCMADALVLEGIVLRAAAELASGFYIPKAIEDLKHFWSLIPEWIDTCKQVFTKPTNYPNSFPEFPDSIYSTLKYHIGLIDNELKVPSDCIESFVFSIEHVNKIGQALNKNRSQEAGRLLTSLSTIARQVITNCSGLN